MKRLLFIIACLFGSHSGTALAVAPFTLTEYLKAVQAQSPNLRIEKSLKEEASARASGIRLSPTMVGLMNMKDGGGNNQGIEISQEIPFPTKISKDQEVRDNESEAQNASSQYRKNEILLMARNAYFEYWQAFERAEIIKEKKDWLKSHSKIARSAARSDSAAQLHLLGIESEVDLLENESLEAESKLIEKRNAMKVFAPELQVSTLAPSQPKLETLEIDPKSKSALLVWKESEVKAADSELGLKKQAYLPDLFLRYRGYNGNDMAPQSQEVMVGITLPFLFFWQPRAESLEASARSQRAQAELKKTQIDLESRLSTLSEKTQALKKQLNTLNDKLIPRAHKRMKLVDNLSQRTMEGLNEHRAVMLDYMDLRIKALDVRTEYEISISEMLKFASSEVTP